MTNLLFVTGNVFARYALMLAKNMEVNGFKTCFSTNLFPMRRKIAKNGWSKADIFFPNIEAGKKSSVNECGITNSEIKAEMEFVVTKSAILGNQIDLDEDFYKNCNRIINYYDDIVTSRKISAVLMWNYKSFPNNLIKLVCEKRRIKCVFFEEGLFRPAKLTVDPQGLNYENSVPRDKDFFKALDEANEPTLDRELIISDRRILELNRWAKKAAALEEKISLITQPYSRFMNFDQVKRRKTLLKLMSKLDREQDSINLDGRKIIFIPFQVRVDTQIICFSPRIKNMIDLTDAMVTAFRSAQELGYFKDYVLAFKEHPADFGSVAYQDLFSRYAADKDILFLKRYPVNDLIEAAEFVVTVNSTVGIEALQSAKKVLVLGNAFFAIEGLVKINNDLNCLTDDLIAMTTFEPDPLLRHKFIHYVKDIYNVNGDKNSFTGENTRALTQRVIDLVNG